MKKITIVIADDHKIFTNSLRSLLEMIAQFTVIGEFHDGTELINFLNNNSVDIVLLDLDMKGKNGIEVLKAFQGMINKPKFIVISMFYNNAVVNETYKLGASAYLAKNAGREELITTIENVYNNTFPINATPNQIEEKDKFKSLTQKEREVLKAIVMGKSNQQIADDLFCSIYTIQTHRRNIHNKLGIKGHAALINFATENHFLI